MPAVSMRERSEICPRCGRPGRLVIEMDDKLLDRCYSCGYERLTELPLVTLVGVVARPQGVAASR
jgi:hypothetical protein